MATAIEVLSAPYSDHHMWQTCRKCGWWQKGRGPCQGCRFSTGWPSSSRPLPRHPAQTPTDNASPEILRERWQTAKQSAQDPKHVKIERMCPVCLTRTLGNKSICRGCHRDMTNCMRVLPGQWPPLNCPAHLLAQYEQPTAVSGQPPSKPVVVDAPMGGTDVSPPERPMQSLSLAQLKAEKMKLERHILELPNEGFTALREQLEESLGATTREIQCRKPAGQTLDQALARHKTAVRAKAAAEEHLAQAEASLIRAKAALQQAADHETYAAQEVTRVKAAITEEDSTDNGKTLVPPDVMNTVYHMLQQAGLQASQLVAVARTLGSPLPPSPPAPAAAASHGKSRKCALPPPLPAHSEGQLMAFLERRGCIIKSLAACLNQPFSVPKCLCLMIGGNTRQFHTKHFWGMASIKERASGMSIVLAMCLKHLFSVPEYLYTMIGSKRPQFQIQPFGCMALIREKVSAISGYLKRASISPFPFQNGCA